MPNHWLYHWQFPFAMSYITDYMYFFDIVGMARGEKIKTCLQECMTLSAVSLWRQLAIKSIKTSFHLKKKINLKDKMVREFLRYYLSMLSAMGMSVSVSVHSRGAYCTSLDFRSVIYGPPGTSTTPLATNMNSLVFLFNFRYAPSGNIKVRFNVI